MNAARLKLLYDGACPVCRRQVRGLRRVDRRGRVEFIDIAAADFDARRLGLTAEDVQGALHAILPDGRVVRAMAAVRAVYREVGLGWLAAPTGWPGLRPVFDRLYRLFARHRRRIGRWLGGD